MRLLRDDDVRIASFINQAKQSTTRASRVEKYVPRIMDGLGPQD